MSDVNALLDELEHAGVELIYARHLATSRGLLSVPVVWNGRLRTRAGCCRVMRPSGKVVRIELNPRLRAEGTAAIVETFLHELAHAALPLDGHSRHWLLLHRSIGGKGERCHAFASMAPH